MRLSKSTAVSLEGDRICCFRKTIAQRLAERSLTILIDLDTVKTILGPCLTQCDQVIALLALAQDQVPTVQSVGRR